MSGSFSFPVPALRPVRIGLFLAVLLAASAHAGSAAAPGENRGQSPVMRPQAGPIAWDDAAGVVGDFSGSGLKAPGTRGQLLDGHKLAVYYVIPIDFTFEQAVLDRLVAATLDIQAWYQCATGGLTWTLAYPEVVRVYYGLHSHVYYHDNGDWWGSLLGEMEGQGYPIWESGTVAALWARGAGWWAGGAQWCSGQCGVVLLGVECFPEFNIPAISGGECPGGQGVGAWPCTPVGAYAHELGHTLGLPHPADDPSTSAYANHSIMQTHWNYPDYAPSGESPWGFLTLERTVIQTNPFQGSGISLRQTHPQCDVVNLPNNGPAPTAFFSDSTAGQTVFFTNGSTGAVRTYWVFGDSAVSNEVQPSHTYGSTPRYAVRLRSSASNAMMAMSEETGTCCNEVTGACALLPLDDCPAPRVWSHEVANCSPNPCSPSGACCWADMCYLRTQTWCETSGLVYQGVGTVCEPNPCYTSGALPTGPVAGETWLDAAPNPFARSVSLSIRLTKTERLRFELYDAAGRAVQARDLGMFGPGLHTWEWDGLGRSGGAVGPGIYLARLRAGERVWTKMLIRVQ